MRRRISTRFLVLLAYPGCFLGGGGLAPSEGEAQVVQGRLADASTRDPVGYGLVRLLDLEGSVVGAAVSDSAGFYRLQVPGPGFYRLSVVRMGYATGEGFEILDLKADDVLQAELLLLPDPLALEGIIVEAESHPWRLQYPPSIWPFFDRRDFYGKLGMGRFMDREDLEGWSGDLEAIPEIRWMLFTMQSRSITYPCRGPTWYLDGHRVTGDIMDLVRVSDLEGVEVYRRASEVPGEFGGSDARCGVVVLWTRR